VVFREERREKGGVGIKTKRRGAGMRLVLTSGRGERR
jgi:hypothetical protein